MPATTYRAGGMQRDRLSGGMTTSKWADASKRRRKWIPVRIAAVVSAMAIVGAVVWAGQPGAQRVQAAFYGLSAAAQRSSQRAAVRLTLGDWSHVALPGVELYVEPGVGAAGARAVEHALSRGEPAVTRDFGVSTHHVWPVALVTRNTMAARLRVAPGAAPLGYYQGGVIWLLDPGAFLPDGPGLSEVYGRRGPVVHELTHEADAVVSGGTVPRWFDEGLAQYEDWRLTGYVWLQSNDTFTQPPYTWRQLDGGAFGNLPNQALAYRQALATTAAICRRGAGTCVQVLRQLRMGAGMSAAIDSVAGPSLLSRIRSGAFWAPGTGPEPGSGAGPAP